MTNLPNGPEDLNKNTLLTWIMIAILAAIAASYYFLEGSAQSTAVTVVLIAGLVAIIVNASKK